MIAPSSLKKRLSTVSQYCEQHEHDKALEEVEALLKDWPGNPHLHVLKASLVQLQKEPKHELDEAKQSLRHAIELDRDSPAASIELGHYLDNVEDDSKAAAKAYADGIAAARRLLLDGLIGMAKANLQLDRKEEFKSCLIEILLLAHFDSNSTGKRSEESWIDAILGSSPNALRVFHAKSPHRSTPAWIHFGGKVRGPFAEQIADLLAELETGDFAEPRVSTERRGT